MIRAFAMTAVMTTVCIGSSLFARAADEITADQRLPDCVLLYLGVPNAVTAHESFKQTGLGQLIDDPALEKFRQQLVEKYDEFKKDSEEKLGMALSDITALFAGEVSLAVVRPTGQPLGGVLFMDIGENQKTLNKLIAKAEAADEEKKAEKSSEKIGDVNVTVYTIKVSENEDSDPATVAYFVKDHKLVVASAVSILESVLDRWDGEGEDSFAENEIYAEILDKCWGEENSTPAMQYFVDPVGLLATGLSMNQDTQLFSAMVYSPAFGLNGFKGMGGVIELATEEYDSIGRTMYYVDGPASGLLKIFEFRPTITAPPEWVPGDAGQFVALDWNIKGAYEAIESIYDSFTGPGKFAAMVAGASQQSGTGLHFKKDVVDVLSGQFQWYMTPGETPEAFNGAVSIGVNDAAKGQKLIDIVMTQTGGADKSDFKGVQLSTATAEGQKVSAAVKDKAIFIAPNPDLLKLSLSGPAKASLLKSETYTTLSEEIPDQVSLLAYQNPADQLESGYEKARAGDFDSFTEGKLDFSTLPAFAEIKKYFTPSASYFVPDEHGTLGVQFSLKRKK